MKKVLFIVHEYYPFGSAITNCIKPIISEMNNQNIQVSILTRRTHYELKKYEIIDNVEIYRINDFFNLYNNKVANSKNKLEKICNRIILKLVWVYRTKIKKESEGFLNQTKAIKLGKKIIKENYDTIISCSYPFAMHKIAKELKKDAKINWIAYQFDPHTFNHTLDKSLTTKRLNEEINTFSTVNKIFLPKENYEENIKTELKNLKEKYYPIDFALIKEKKYNITKSQSDKIKFVFTGTFYENIRMPDDMFEFFKNIDIDYEIHLYYIAEKNVENNINEYKNYFKNKINLHYNKTKKECDEALKNADIIINIGNKISNQTPSKVFEYISLGKPIVNFYSIENDTSKKVLNKYPLVLNIPKDYKDEDIKRFIKFCEENKDKKLDFSEIAKKYKTAEVIAKEFIKEVGDIVGDK